MAQKTKQSRITTDHDIIKRWVKERDGKPAHIKNTGRGGGAGVLRIDFPGKAEEELESISWDDFFEQFEKNNLAFLYQEERQGGETSRFNKFVDRDAQE